MAERMIIKPDKREMKKGAVLAIVITVLGLSSVEAKAQSSNSPSTQQPVTAQAQQPTGKQQISEEELPDGIKEALKSDVLTPWEVSEVYRVAAGAENTKAGAMYEVYFTNAEQMRAIARFDREGNTVGGKQ